VPVNAVAIMTVLVSRLRAADRHGVICEVPEQAGVWWRGEADTSAEAVWVTAVRRSLRQRRDGCVGRGRTLLGRPLHAGVPAPCAAVSGDMAATGQRARRQRPGGARVRHGGRRARPGAASRKPADGGRVRASVSIVEGLKRSPDCPYGLPFGTEFKKCIGV
jgi:hypothetical protein